MSLEAKERMLEKALEESRDIARRTDLDDEERADLIRRVDRIEGLKAEVAEDYRIKAALAGGGSGATDDEIVAHFNGKSLGEAYIDSEEFLNAKAVDFLGNSAAFHFKAEPTVITSLGDGSGSDLSGIVAPQHLPGIVGLHAYPTRVADLIPKMKTNAASVTYFLETGETSTIGPQDGEGTEKGNFTLEGTEVTEVIEVIGGMGAVSRQTLEDAPFFAGFVNTRMTLKLDQVEENLLLNGDGTNGELDGFANRAGINTFDGTGETDMDAIYKAMDEILVTSGFPADAVVMAPGDWQPIVLSKDGNDRYYGSGPFAVAVGDSIWGVPVIKSAFQVAGTALVGAFKNGSWIVTKGGVMVRTSDSHSDYFKKNKVAVLIEKREGLGVPTPLGFSTLTFDAS